MSRPFTDVATRFWKKVAICKHGNHCTTCCWEWQAGHSQGYGSFSMPPHLKPGHTRIVRATRVCWWLTYGVWPTDQHVLHSCDNPPCVQPAHLWLGRARDNLADATEKGRLTTAGEANPAAKLTPELVLQIRSLAAQRFSNTKIKEILHLNVRKETISKVRNRHRWSHIP
jgi:hypothetical protein